MIAPYIALGWGASWGTEVLVTTGETTGESARTVGLLEAMRRGWLLVLLSTLVAGAVGFATSFLSPVEYSASARIYVAQPVAIGAAAAAKPESFAQNEAERAASPGVLDRVTKLLSPSISGAELQRQVRARWVEGRNLIRVTATAPSAQRAVDVANAVVVAYVAVVSEERTAARAKLIDDLAKEEATLRERIAATSGPIDAARAAIDTARLNGTVPPAQSQLDQLVEDRRVAYAQLEDVQRQQRELTRSSAQPSAAERIEPANLPSDPTSPNRGLNGAVAGVLGLVVASLLAWHRAEEQRKVEDEHDVGDLLGIRLLGCVPDRGELIDGLAAAGEASDVAATYQLAAFHLLRDLEAEIPAGGKRSIVVTEPITGSRATQSALSIAFALAQTGRRVTLVDADFRHRSLTRLASMEFRGGLSDTDWSSQEGLGVFFGADGVSMRVVPTGMRCKEPSTFFNSEAFVEALRVLEADSDVVIIDAPALTEAPEASIAAGRVGKVVLSVRHGTPFDVVTSSGAVLARVDARVLGYLFRGKARFSPFRRGERRGSELTLAEPMKRDARADRSLRDGHAVARPDR